MAEIVRAGIGSVDAGQEEATRSIGMLKMTSLVSVISLLLVCCCWYLFMTSVMTVIQGRIERHYSRGRQGAGQSRGGQQ
ncbi:hypothetical protein [Breoghania sp.]|uniref:hypothetical protein n=1 Tax=Breoghania sp. TaxID=2065378 RepID=UPI00262AD808|nr:hypothetical protein [Breoghania sp.]MDJ0933716.1 hypothetical protein [Breoghania sp.]